jgi:hypothetical protein
MQTFVLVAYHSRLTQAYNISTKIIHCKTKFICFNYETKAMEKSINIVAKTKS